MRILNVEDDFLIANRLTEAFTQERHEIVGVAASADKAIELLASCTSNLSRSCSEPVGKALLRRGIPFVVVSGYSREHLLGSLRGAPFLPKPVDQSALLALVASFRKSTAVMA